VAKILIMESDDYRSGVLGEGLRGGGHVVDFAYDCPAAWDAVTGGDYHVLMVDATQCRDEAYRLCARVRSDARVASLPVVMLAGLALTDEDERLAREAGADALLDMLETGRGLLEAVQRVLDGVHRTGERQLLTSSRVIAPMPAQDDGSDTSATGATVSEHCVAASRESYWALMDELPMLVATLALDGRVDFVNKLARQFIGAGEIGACLGRLTAGMDPRRAVRFSGALRNAFLERVSDQFETHVTRHDGAWRVLRASVTPYFGPDGQHLGVVVACLDVTEERECHQMLRQLSETDQLTGLLNREAFESRLEAVISRSAGGIPSALVYVRVEGLSEVADRCGHAAAEATLRAVATALRELGEGEHVVSRLGEAEFGLLAYCVGAAGAAELVEAARSQVGRVRVMGADPSYTLGVVIESELLGRQAPDEGIRGQDLSDAAAPTVQVSTHDAQEHAAVRISYTPFYVVETRHLHHVAAVLSVETEYGQISLAQALEGGVVGGPTGLAMTALEQLHGALSDLPDVMCTVALPASVLGDPMIFERTEVLAGHCGVDPARLAFELSANSAIADLPGAWMRAAQHSIIGLTLDCTMALPSRDLDGLLEVIDCVSMMAASLCMEHAESRPATLIVRRALACGVEVIAVGACPSGHERRLAELGLDTRANVRAVRSTVTLTSISERADSTVEFI